VIAAQVQRYRFHSTPQQRQQTKWMVYGSGLIVTSIIAGVALQLAFPYSASTPAQTVLVDLASAGLLTLIWAVVPLAVAVAMFRYRLWDIDLVIRRTLIYSALTASLAAIYFVVVALLQLGVRGLTGQQQPALVTVVSTLGIAALFTPLRRRIQSGIDRQFYRNRYDAARALAEFASAAREEVDPERLTGRLLRVVSETLQPESASVWLRPAPDRRPPMADDLS